MGLQNLLSHHTHCTPWTGHGVFSMLWDSFKQGFNISRACIKLALSIVAPPVFSSPGKTEGLFPRLKILIKNPRQGCRLAVGFVFVLKQNFSLWSAEQFWIKAFWCNEYSNTQCVSKRIEDTFGRKLIQYRIKSSVNPPNVGLFPFKGRYNGG